VAGLRQPTLSTPGPRPHKQDPRTQTAQAGPQDPYRTSMNLELRNPVPNPQHATMSTGFGGARERSSRQRLRGCLWGSLGLSIFVHWLESN
jgi:hypothetical protein